MRMLPSDRETRFVEIRENKEIPAVFSTWLYRLAVDHAISRYFAVSLIAG